MEKVVLPTVYFSSYLNRWHDVAFHLNGNMLWQDGEEEPLQLLVLVLHLKARGNAVARVQERAPLPLLGQVVDEQANLGAHNQKRRTSELKTTRELEHWPDWSRRG